MTRSPTFLVIGAGRSGTTSLHHHLAAHPDVFVPSAKSPSHWYCLAEPDSEHVRSPETQRLFVREPAAYRALFHDCGDRTAIGEVSPAYLASTRVPAVIAAHLPDVRLVAVLRDPVDRFVARYVARCRDGLEARTFAVVVADEMAAVSPRLDAAGTYLAAGYVAPVLSEYQRLFPAERLHVLLYEDLADDTASAVASVFAHIGVDPTVPIDPTRHNSSRGVIANPVVRAVWTRSARVRRGIRPYVPARIRDGVFGIATRSVTPADIPAACVQQLRDVYAGEVTALEQVLERDLSHWRTPT